MKTVQKLAMILTPLDAPDGPAPAGGYTQAMLVEGASRLLFISGQIPETPDAGVPSRFDAQCRLVWHNIEGQLRAGGMDFDNLVKVTTFLSDREYRDANSVIRREMLGERRPALTIIIAEIYAPEWLLEIEAIAAA